MQVVFHPEAWQDYHDILAYYDAHSLWQAERFTAELDTLIAGIEQQPLRWPPHLKDIRRAQFDHFPHHLYYRLHDDTIHVEAVVHQRRHPDHWLKRYKTGN